MVREASRGVAMRRGAIMAELVDDAAWRRHLQPPRRSIGATKKLSDGPRTIHCFCGKACGQACLGRREGACSRASRWIARVLSSEPMWMRAMPRGAAQAAKRRAIVVR